MSRAGSTAARSRPSGTAALDKANPIQRAASRFDADAQGLAATFVWDSGDGPGPYDTVVRVSGRRLGVVGPRTRKDDFVREEHVRGIIPGSGPVSVTTQVHHINAGEWSVTAELTRASARKRVEGRARPAKKGTGRRRLSRGSGHGAGGRSAQRDRRPSARAGRH